MTKNKHSTKHNKHSTDHQNHTNKPKKQHKTWYRKLWHFIWEDDSILSWIVNIVLAFVLIKFIVYPGLGLIMGSQYPIVAVVSGSMEHPDPFNEWWALHEPVYLSYDITRSDFEDYSFRNGFNKGDIMILVGEEPEDIEIGEVIVFTNGQPDPIIHRVVMKWKADDYYYFQTKGDNNPNSGTIDRHIRSDRVIGKAVVRIPLLGYIKIWATDFLSLLGVGNVLS